MKLAALALVAALQAGSTPIVGGGSFNAAPIIEPGAYRDTILPSEYLYYGVRLEPGQRLHVTANTELDIQSFQALGMTDITANLHSPSRAQVASDVDSDSRGSFRSADDPPLDITGPAASPEGDSGTTGPWTGSGVYYLAFYGIYAGVEETPPRAEIPFHFDVEVVGEAVATPTPTPSPTASPVPTASVAPAPPAEDDDGFVLPIAVGILGVGLGALGGWFVRRRR